MLSAPNKVDLVVEKDHPPCWRLLIIVEAGEWQHPRARWFLQEKVNAYASYALDGEMQRKYPESGGMPVSIVIRPVDPVPADVEVLISKVTALLAPEGLAVTVEPLPPESQAA